MSDRRVFPPSTRRRNLARAAGLTAASPVLVGALAAAGALIAIVALGRAAAASLGAWIAAACDGTAALATAAPARDGAVPAAAEAVARAAAAGVPRRLLELALPVLAAAAIAAAVAHLAQTRAVWLPRRRLPGAPAPAPRRVRRAALDLLAAATVGAVVVGWLWLVAPRLAALPVTPLAGALLVASFVATLAIAWAVLGIGDALVRHAELAEALRMTPAEQREDARLAGADPRWRARRAELAREGGAGDERAWRDAVTGASVLVLGDGVAAAIAWDPVRRPVPVRTAAGRAARATQLLALARRHGVPVHRDAELATALAALAAHARIPEAQWPRLAEIVAATGRPAA